MDVMEIKQLQYFLAVADQLNFSKAAETLYVTQPLLSQQISELEQQLDVTLFNRTRRSVSLTPAGAALAREAHAILTQVNHVGSVVRRAAAGIGLECDINIGFEEVFERTRLTQSAFRFRAQHPSYHCKLKCYSFSQMMRALHEGDIDLGFTLLPNKKLAADLEVQVVEQDHLVMVAASELLAEPTLERFLLLSESLPLCLMDKDSRGTNSIIQLCVEFNIAPQFEFYGDAQTLLMNVEAGGGITMLPSTMIRTYASPYLSTLPLDTFETARLTLAACWNQKNSNPAIPIFLDCLLS